MNITNPVLPADRGVDDGQRYGGHQGHVARIILRLDDPVEGVTRHWKYFARTKDFLAQSKCIFEK